MIANRKKYWHTLSAFTLSIFLLFVVTFEWIGSSLPSIRFLTLGIYGVGVTLWVVSRMRSKTNFEIPRWFLLLTLYFLYQAILVLISPNPLHSFELQLSFLLLLGFTLFLADSLHWHWTFELWENAIIGLAILFSFFNLFSVYGWLTQWFEMSGSPLSTPPFGYRIPGFFLSHPNIEAGFVNIALILSIVRFFGASSIKQRVAWIGAFTLFGGVLYFTSSRGGWLAGFIGIMITTGLIYGRSVVSIFRRGEYRTIFSNKKVMAGVVISVTLGLAIAGLLSFQVQTTGHNPIASARSSIWSISWEVFRISPILGSGPGSSHIFTAEVAGIPPGFYMSHAHNLFLQIAGESGIIGLLILGWLAIHFVRLLLRTWQKSEEYKKHLAAYIGILAGMFFHNQVDYLFEPPLYLLGILIIVGLASSEAPDVFIYKTPRRNVAIGIIVGLFFYLLGHSFLLKGYSTYYDGLEAAKQDEWKIANENICNSMNVNDDATLFGFQCGLTQSILSDIYDQEERLDFAETSIELSLLQDPYWPIHWANLAAIEHSNGKQAEALEHIQIAIDRAPRNAQFYLQLGWMLEQLGEIEKAGDAFRMALRVNPWIDRTLFFTGSNIRTEAIENSYLTGLVKPSDRLTWLGSRAFTKGELVSARSLLDHAITLDSRNWRAYSFLALINLLEGNEEATRKNIQLALLLNEDEPQVQLIAGRIALKSHEIDQALDYFDRAFGLLMNSSSSTEYYSTTYRRGFLPMDLVPQMVRAVLTQDSIEDFIQYAELLRMTNDPMKSELVIDFIEREKFFALSIGDNED